MKQTPSSWRATASSAVGMLLLAACAGLGKPPEQVVTERAQARVNLVLAEDYAAAYQYLSPGYRTGLSEQDYQRKMLLRRVRWTNAEVLESECSSNSCKVWISVEYVVHGGLPGVRKMESMRRVEEDWVLSDGNWFFLPPD